MKTVTCFHQRGRKCGPPLTPSKKLMGWDQVISQGFSGRRTSALPDFLPRFESHNLIYCPSAFEPGSESVDARASASGSSLFYGGGVKVKGLPSEFTEGANNNSRVL